jgi:seryl-tRNA synthetase
MIDLAALRAQPDHFRTAWNARGLSVDLSELLAIDEKVRALKFQSETKRSEQNAASKAIAAVAKSGGDVGAAKDAARRLGDDAAALDKEREGLESQLHQLLLLLPNPCLASVPVGKDSSENVAVATWGEKPAFAFTAKPHWDLGPALGIMDFERATKLSGSGFVVLSGAGARLARALVSWFLDTHVDRHGYTELAVPYLVTAQTMQGTGQLPKFADQLFACKDDPLLLIPTAEVPVTNLHSGEILDHAALPLKYTAHTPCFRREAGAAGLGTRGMTRVHQFDKVEVVWLTTPERSDADLLTLRGHAEWLLQQLGLHYRVLELCTGDTGFSSAHTYDLEVWSAGTNSWLEVSSCSTFTDFQGRRANLRYRPAPGADGKPGKPQFVHTLNGSGLALPRCLIALLETHQQADGSIRVPEVLRPYLGGLAEIRRSEERGAGSGESR